MLQMKDLFWDYFHRMEIRSLEAFVKRVAPGTPGKAGPDGCYEGKSGKISRCCTGYGIHHCFWEWYKRHKGIELGFDAHAARMWFVSALEHYPQGHDAIMKLEKHPPGEYVNIEHTKDDEYDELRHVNNSGIFRIAADPLFRDFITADMRAELCRVATETGNWLFSVDWHRQRNWHIRHHYPIQMAVWLYNFLRDPKYIYGACSLLRAFWSNPREVLGSERPAPGIVRSFYSYDIGRPSDEPEPRLGWGSSQLTFFPWYNSLICQSLFELYMVPITPSWARRLCVEVVRNITDWYLFRQECPLGDLHEAGDKLLINAPMQGGMHYLEGETDQPWLTTGNRGSVLSDDEWDTLEDDEPYWPYMFMKATEVRPYDLVGDYFEPEIDGETRYHHPRRFFGGPGKAGILGPQLEASGPAKAIADALAIRAAIEWVEEPIIARMAHLRARRVLVDGYLFMHHGGVAPAMKKDGLGISRPAEDGIWNTAAGNNRMPYWVGNSYRILAALEENGWFDVGKLANPATLNLDV